MNYKGDVYVFDFDDTLAWCPNWYDEVVIDDGGYVSDPGGSVSVCKALGLFKETNFKLQVESSNVYHKEIYFLVTQNGSPITMDELSTTFSLEEIKLAQIQEFLGYASVSTDYEYYIRPRSVGFKGFNQEMLNLYKLKHENSIILTARQSLPGIKERILEYITTEAPAPMNIVTQPVGTMNSGKYKGNVLVDIAKSPDVNNVYFYDDNLNYISEARKVVDASGLNDTITITHVNTSNKPQGCWRV